MHTGKKVIFFILLCSVIPAVYSETLDLSPAKSIVLNSFSPDTVSASLSNYVGTYMVSGRQYSARTLAFFNLDLVSELDNKHIVNARLKITLAAGAAQTTETPVQVSFHSVQEPWNQPTWNAMPGFEHSGFAVTTFSKADDYYISITELARAWQQTPAQNHGILIQAVSEDGNTLKQIDSLTLIIEFEDANECNQKNGVCRQGSCGTGESATQDSCGIFSSAVCCVKPVSITLKESETPPLPTVPATVPPSQEVSGREAVGITPEIPQSSESDFADLSDGAYSPLDRIDSTASENILDTLAPLSDEILADAASDKPQSEGFIVEFTSKPLVVKQRELILEATEHEKNPATKAFNSVLAFFLPSALEPTLSSNVDKKLQEYNEQVLSKEHEEFKIEVAQLLLEYPNQNTATQNTVTGMAAGVPESSGSSSTIPPPSSTIPRSGIERYVRQEYTAAFNGMAFSGDIFVPQAAIRKLPQVKKIHSDNILRPLLQESVPLIHADYAHKNGYTGKGVKVAVLDTGIDYTHQDFGDCTEKFKQEKEQEDEYIDNSVEMEQSLGWKNFKKKYGNNWKVQWDSLSMRPRSISGFNIKSTYLGVRDIDKNNAEQAGKLFLKLNSELLNIDSNALQTIKVQEAVSRNPSHDSGLYSVTYRQNYKGLPVFNSYVSVGFINNKLVSFNSEYFDVDIDTTPHVSASESAKNAITKIYGKDKIKEILGDSLPYAADDSLGIYVASEDEVYASHLVHKIELPLVRKPLSKITAYVDAKTGEVVDYFDNLRYEIEVSGKVAGSIIPEYPAQGHQDVDISHNEIRIGDSEYYTDKEGTYTAHVPDGKTQLRSRLHGPWVRVINDEQNTAPTYMTFEEGNNQLYLSGKGTVQRAVFLDGDYVLLEDVVEGITRLRNSPIAFDTVRKKIYWKSSINSDIKRADYDGKNEEFFNTKDFNTGGIAFDSANGNLYWITREYVDGYVPEHKIVKMNHDGTGKADVLSGFVKPESIAIDSNNGKIYWTEDIRYALKKHNSKNDVLRSSSRLSGGAIDTEKNIIYWVEENAVIRKSDLEGKNIKTVAPKDKFDNYIQNDISIDPIHEKIYWFEDDPSEGNSKIFRADTDGKNKKVIITYPTIGSISINYLKNKIYFSDLLNDKILMADFDGGNVQDVIAETVAIHLTVDSKNGKIYWLELGAITDIIRVADFDGKNANDLITIEGWSNLDDMALDIDNQMLYWSEHDYLDTHAIYKLNLKDNSKSVAASDVSADFIALDRSGNIYYIYTPDDAIYKADISGKNIEFVASIPDTEVSPLFIDTENQKLYLTYYDYNKGTEDIFKVNTDGTNEERIKIDERWWGVFAVDAKNKKLYYSVQGGQLVQMDINGDNKKYYNLVTPQTTSYNGDAIVPTQQNWNWKDYDQSERYEETNVFYHTNKVHDYFNGLGVTEIDTQFIGTVNIADTCNAYYSSNTINFYSAGDECENTALLSDVIYHEYTHGVVDDVVTVYFPYQGMSGAINEGLADYFAVTINDNPCMGEGFYKNDETKYCLRNAKNTMRYPDDYYDGTNDRGGVHINAPIFTGALWDLREQLGKDITDTLVIQAMRLQPITFSMFLDKVLTVDDDNGNLDDGTPHQKEICRAFTQNHGIESPYCPPSRSSAPCTIADGYDFVNNDNDPMDDEGHGTHVASIIGAHGKVTGVAPEVAIYGYKVCGEFDCPESDIMAAIERSIDPNQDGKFDDKVDIISISIGGSGSPDDAESVSIDNAVDAGISVVVSAGNSGPGEQTVDCPACARSAIAVGATFDKNYDESWYGLPKLSDCFNHNPTSNDVACFSSRGPFVWDGGILQKPDVVAPGVETCAAQWDTAYGIDDTFKDTSRPDLHRCVDSEHMTISGTSMAAPMVSGAVAVIKQAHPDWHPLEIKAALQATADDLGLDKNIGGAGRINVERAVALKVPPAVVQLSGVSQNRETNQVVITGTVFSRNLKEWTLFYGEGASPEKYIFLASGNFPLTNGILTQQDGLRFTAGATYTLLLEIEDSDTKISDSLAFVRDDRSFVLFADTKSENLGFRMTIDDIDLDGRKEVILSGLGGGLFVFDADGQEKEHYRDSDLVGAEVTPLDFTGDTTKEIGYTVRNLDTYKSGYLDHVEFIDSNGLKTDITEKILNFYKDILQKKCVKDSCEFQDFDTYFTYPIANDLDNDGKEELLLYNSDGISFVLKGSEELIYENGDLFALSFQGILGSFPVHLNLTVEPDTVPVVADLEPDGIPEIILAGCITNQDGDCEEQHMAAIESTGGIKKGWPYTSEVPFTGWDVFESVDVLAADVNGDGSSEVIMRDTQRLLHAIGYNGEELPRWPKNIEGNYFRLSAGDIDNDLMAEIVVASQMEVDMQNMLFLSVYKDVLSDPLFQIRVPTKQSWIKFRPLIADVNGDDYAEILFVATPWIYAVDKDGKNVAGWPKYLRDVRGIEIEDVDADGTLELFAYPEGPVKIFRYDFETEFNPKKLEWPSYQHDPQHTGWYQNHYQHLKLENYPDFFINDGQLDVTMVIPDGPYSPEFKDAIARISRSLEKYGKVPIVLESAFQKEQAANVIFISDSKNLAAKNYISDDYYYYDGLLKIVPKKEHAWLFVTGDNDTGILEAARTLENSDEKSNLHGYHHRLYSRREFNPVVDSDFGTLKFMGSTKQSEVFHIPGNPATAYVGTYEDAESKTTVRAFVQEHDYIISEADFYGSVVRTLMKSRKPLEYDSKHNMYCGELDNATKNCVWYSYDLLISLWLPVLSTDSSQELNDAVSELLTEYETYWYESEVLQKELRDVFVIDRDFGEFKFLGASVQSPLVSFAHNPGDMYIGNYANNLGVYVGVHDTEISEMDFYEKVVARVPASAELKYIDDYGIFCSESSARLSCYWSSKNRFITVVLENPKEVIAIPENGEAFVEFIEKYTRRYPSDVSGRPIAEIFITPKSFGDIEFISAHRQKSKSPFLDIALVDSYVGSYGRGVYSFVYLFSNEISSEKLFEEIILRIPQPVSYDQNLGMYCTDSHINHRCVWASGNKLVILGVSDMLINPEGKDIAASFGMMKKEYAQKYQD